MKLPITRRDFLQTTALAAVTIATRVEAQENDARIAEVDELVAKWNRDPTVAIRSPEFMASVESLREDAAFGLPAGAEGVEMKSLSPPQLDDLNRAIAGFLRAYEAGTSDAVFDYMQERGKDFHAPSRRSLERQLLKRGAADPASLNDKDLYRAAWAAFRSHAHWHGLTPDASSRRVWNGKRVPVGQLRMFNLSSDEDAKPETVEQAAYLFRVFRSNNTPQNNFIEQAGSIAESHQKDERVLFCDARLVIEFDDSLTHSKAAYLCRFWLNDAAKKWQPVYFTGFPQQKPLPTILF